MTDTSDISDEQLVKYIREKDKEKYAEIIKRFKDKLMRYALYLTDDYHLAADVVQESFIKTYINLNSFDIKKKFSSWIYRIVHNEAMNILRNRSNQKFPILENVEFDSGINLENDLIKKELQAHTHYCLKNLPILYREPLSLFFLEDKSYEEISDILRLPTGTVGTRINRGKILMKKICQKLKK